MQFNLKIKTFLYLEILQLYLVYLEALTYCIEKRQTRMLIIFFLIILLIKMEVLVLKMYPSQIERELLW